MREDGGDCKVNLSHSIGVSEDKMKGLLLCGESKTVRTDGSFWKPIREHEQSWEILNNIF